jgi:hypothetical protein
MNAGMEPAIPTGRRTMTTLDANLTLHPIPTSRAATAPSKAARRTGLVLSTVIVLLLGLDAFMKLLQVAPVLAGTVHLGYAARSVLPIGIILSVCVIAYVIPRTSLLGAVLLTGYLGGAVATHVRVGDPLWSLILFPVYVGAVVWSGLVLRDARLRALLKTLVAR